MLNLAPYRYGRAVSESKGPICKVEIGRLSWHTEELLQANAYLSERFGLETRSDSAFVQADGCGTHSSAMVARHMAISEALERWALYHTYQHGARAAYGLDLDSTSCGMAAWPGLFARQARRFAMREAVERYCLAEWTCGKLTGSLLHTDRQDACPPGIEIVNPLDRHRVVIVWRQLDGGQWVYGFSAERSLDSAIFKAQIEMERLAVVVRDYYARHPGFRAADLPGEMDILERRILNFSLQEGHDSFLEHVERSTNISMSNECPSPVIDRHMPGPWDRYTCVWRVLFPMPEKIYDTNRADVFYW